MCGVDSEGLGFFFFRRGKLASANVYPILSLGVGVESAGLVSFCIQKADFFFFVVVVCGCVMRVG